MNGKQDNAAFFEEVKDIKEAMRPNDKVRGGKLLERSGRITRDQGLDRLNILLGTQGYLVQDADDFIRLVGTFPCKGMRSMIVGTYSDRLRDFFSTPKQLADLMAGFYGIQPYGEDDLQEAVLMAIGTEALARIIQTPHDWETLKAQLIQGDGDRECWWSDLQSELGLDSPGLAP